MQLYIDRVLLETLVAVNGRGASVRVGGAASATVVPGLGIVPIPWRGRTVELRLSRVGHAAIGVDAEVRCDGTPVPPLARATQEPFAGPACPGCGGAGGDAVDGTRCRPCFASDDERHLRAVRGVWGVSGGIGALVTAPLASIAVALARSPEDAIPWAGVAGAAALVAGSASGVLIVRALRGKPWSPPVAPPAVRWNLDMLRMLQSMGDAPLGMERGPAWDRLKDTLISAM